MNIEYINRHLLFDTTPTKADVAILLGGRGVSGDIARAAALDFRRTAIGLCDYFTKIIVCGGVPVRQMYTRPLLGLIRGTQTRAEDFSTREREADYMHRVLLGEGVPEKNIIFTENTSRHTGGNLANIRAFIKLSGIQTANIYTTAYHARRAIETAAVEIPDLACNPVSVWPYGLDAEQWRLRWHKNPLTRWVVTQEYKKINPEKPGNFYDKGICRPVHIK